MKTRQEIISLLDSGEAVSKNEISNQDLWYIRNHYGVLLSPWKDTDGTIYYSLI